MGVTVSLRRSKCQDDVMERVQRAIEPELAEAGVDPNQVELESLKLEDSTLSRVEIEVEPR